MADAHAKHHDYHLVDPSPWPAVGSVSAFILAVGAISWMHHMYPAAPLVFGVGVLGILYTFVAWWRDVIREAHGGDHTPVVQLHLRYGMIMFIASEVMFFVAWFWAYFDVALFPAAVYPLDVTAPDGTIETGKQVHQSGFAAAGFADDRQAITFSDRKVDTLKCLVVGSVADVGFGEIPCFEHMV